MKFKLACRYTFNFNAPAHFVWFWIGLIKLTDILKNCTHVFDVEIPERVENIEEKEVFEAFRKQLDENKPKKGKGKKGGKKKKKKWGAPLY